MHKAMRGVILAMLAYGVLIVLHIGYEQLLNYGVL